MIFASSFMEHPNVTTNLNEICFLPKSLGCFYSVWYSYIWRSMLPFLRYCISKMCVMDTHWCIHACTHYHHCIQIHLSSVRSQREITINDYPKSERHTITCTHNHILPSPTLHKHMPAVLDSKFIKTKRLLFISGLKLDQHLGDQ